jgi:hypothetical protein
LIFLAQAYNNEELTASAGPSVDDARLLEIYQVRLLSGAASAHSHRSVEERVVLEPAPITRVRLKKRSPGARGRDLARRAISPPTAG